MINVSAHPRNTLARQATFFWDCDSEGLSGSCCPARPVRQASVRPGQPDPASPARGLQLNPASPSGQPDPGTGQAQPFRPGCAERAILGRDRLRGRGQVGQGWWGEGKLPVHTGG